MALNDTGDRASARVTLVTGAGKGLGRAFALACARRGDHVIVNNRLREGAADSAGRTVEAIRAAGGSAIAEYSDIDDPGAPEQMAAFARDQFGRLDAVILNAAREGAAARFTKSDPGAFDALLATNLSSQVRLTRETLSLLRASHAGRLVFVTSTAGLHGLAGRAAYAASKAGLVAFALTLAQEEAGLAINCMAPYAATRMTEEALPAALAEELSPDAVAPLAAWLSGRECTRTGEIWVAGGTRARRAAMVEGRAQSFDPERGLDPRRTLDGARAFSGAETAFADFVKQLSERSG